jgi:hypothetical protein
VSELRALTKALRSLDSRITGIEDCLVVVLRNSEQESDWRHEQRNLVHAANQEREEQVRAMKQVQDACSAISHKLVHLVERIESLAANQWASDKELRKRVRALESGDEVTQT